MPAPSSYEYSSAATSAATTALLALIDAGSGPGKVRLYSEADLLLAEVTLTDPAGTVAGSGVLTLTQSAAGTAVDDGTCTYGTVVDSDNTVILTLPVSQGSSAVSGELVITNVSIVTGADVSITSATIG